MSLRSRGVLRSGDRVRFEGVDYTVSGLSGVLVRLAEPHGKSRAVMLPQLMADPDFAILTSRPGRSGSSLRGLDGFPDKVVEQAQWWEHHLVEVISGLAPGVLPDAVPRPDYDPTRRSLAEREAAKADELTRLGDARTGLVLVDEIHNMDLTTRNGAEVSDTLSRGPSIWRAVPRSCASTISTRSGGTSTPPTTYARLSSLASASTRPPSSVILSFRTAGTSM
ncbi:hypothetical protein [Microtetraspora malaysiensis]|uniref:hypothetical protein n=1 Tax=Microtetraspora malaysiensis TaxID=161358 RepID=UPI003D8EED91